MGRVCASIVAHTYSYSSAFADRMHTIFSTWKWSPRSSAVFGAIGSYGKVNTWGDYDVRYVVAHSAGGCVTSAASGGDCASGALAAGFAKYTTQAIDAKFSGEGFRENVLNGVATVVAGGTASVLGGGKFENGAITAAYGYLFNQMASRSQEAWQRGTCTTPSMACVQQNAEYRAAYDAKIKSQAIERIYPENEAALMMAAPIRGIALADTLVFKTEHYASRLLADGFSVSRIESLVGADVSFMRANMAINADVGGRIIVDGATIEYRARLLQNGSVNIGTIFPVK